MQSLLSLDLYKLLKEINFLNGGFIRNVKSRKNEFYFLIYSGKEQYLKVVPGFYMCIVNEKPADTIDFGFTTTLRKSLKGKRFNIKMHNADRIIEITTDENTLLIEMFPKGNVILLKNGLVERALFQRSFESREISSGKEYIYPPGQKRSFEDMYADFENMVRSSNKESVVKALAIDFSLGGYYAEELCFRAAVDKGKKVGELGKTEVEALKERFLEIINEVKANVVDNKIFSTVELKHIFGKKEYFDNINSAIIKFFDEKKEEEEESQIKVELSKARERLEEYMSEIEFVKSNYELIEEGIRALENSSVPFSERIKKLEAMGFEVDGRFIIPKEKKDLRIDIKRDLNSFLSDLYEKSKRLKNLDKKELSSSNIVKLKRLKPKTEDAWYTKFRYFYTSAKNLVVIGRDVNQNESLIRKHVEKDDLVGHADVFGSPFGVIKSNGSVKITENDLKEAASMIASYSSAWRAGATNLDVYFVKPEQVSKTPPSGEYLKKGAFYIDGKREYIKNAPLGIYLSIKIEEEYFYASVTPYEPETGFFLLKPGNKSRDEILKKMNRAINNKYGVIISKDYLDRLIPQGKSSIEKVKL